MRSYYTTSYLVIARPMYSNPPVHGARIASEILQDKQLYNSWCASFAARLC